MSPDQLTIFLQRQDQIAAQLTTINVVLTVGLFLALFGLLMMFGLAVWSVSRVNKRQADLEGKFTLLIDVLLRQAEREIAARAAVDIATNVVEVAHGN